MDGTTSNQKHSRREAMKTALAVGAYAAPLVLTAAVPATVSAQVSGGTGTLTGTVTNATNGVPIAGATVTVGGVQGVTNASGVYSIPNAPSGVRTVVTSATGFASRSDAVTIAAAGSTTFSPSLGAGSGVGIQIVLNWGATPSDLDSHLTGPNGGGRFEVAYFSPTPVAYATLDHDDTTSFGPETVTVSPVAGNFVPGDYHYFVHNFSVSPGFNSSAPTPSVTVFQNGGQIAQFLASGATGSDSSAYWHVFNFVLTASPTGAIVITPVQAFTGVAPADSAPLPNKTVGGAPAHELSNRR
jgi:uncharacterized protein YfaP (DUF2135 family)